MVAQLLRCILRWSASQHHQAIHRTAEHAQLKAAYPALKGEACAAKWVKLMTFELIFCR